jgi:hypothetical protein
VLENGDTLAIIETKYEVRKEDVTKFATTQLPKFRTLFPKYSDYKILLGIGGMSFDNYVKEEANKYGIGLIKVVGDKVEFHVEKIIE